MRPSKKNLSVMAVVFGLSGCQDDLEKSAQLTPSKTWLNGAEIAEILCPFQATCEVNGDLGWCVERFAIEEWLRASVDRRIEVTEQVECLRSALNCDDYRDCVYSGQECTESRCDGSIARSCSEGLETSKDCAAIGLTCIDDGSNLGPYCGIPGRDCANLPELSCEENVLIGCVGEQQPRPTFTPCDGMGKTCDTVCVDLGKPACEDEACGLDGVTLSYCINGITSSYNCSELGPEFRCLPSAYRGFECAVPNACVRDAPNAARCEGDTAILCQDHVRSLDCSRVGGTCSMETGRPACTPQ